MADTTTITINREKAYGAFEAEAIAKFGTDLEALEFKASLDLNVTAGTLALTSSLAGVKIEGKLAFSFAAEFGKKYEMFNGITYFGAQAKAKAMLAHAKVLLTETSDVLTEVGKRATALDQGLSRCIHSGKRVDKASVLSIL